MADALYAWRHVSSHAPGRHACAFAKHHQTIIQLEDTALRALVKIRAARNTLHNEACVLQKLRQAAD